MLEKIIKKLQFGSCKTKVVESTDKESEKKKPEGENGMK